MRRRRIYSSLDKNRLRTAADRSRARHLSELMDEQEEKEQESYDRFTDRYTRSRIYQQYGSYFKEFLEGSLAESTNDILETAEEFNLDDYAVWGYVVDALIHQPDVEWSREDGLECKMYEYDDCWKVILISAHREVEVIKINVLDGDNHGDPYDCYINLEEFNEKKFCDVLYDVYSDNGGENLEEFKWFAVDFLEILGDEISNAVERGLEECIKDNPPPLG